MDALKRIFFSRILRELETQRRWKIHYDCGRLLYDVINVVALACNYVKQPNIEILHGKRSMRGSKTIETLSWLISIC